MIRALPIALLLSAAPALAKAETYRVAGVAPGDRLAIRARPDAAAEVLGTIPPDARRIRGFGCTDDTPSGRSWCRVKYGDALGWVRQSFVRAE